MSQRKCGLRGCQLGNLSPKAKDHFAGRGSAVSGLMVLPGSAVEAMTAGEQRTAVAVDVGEGGVKSGRASAQGAAAPSLEAPPSAEINPDLQQPSHITLTRHARLKASVMRSRQHRELRLMSTFMPLRPPQLTCWCFCRL